MILPEILTRVVALFNQQPDIRRMGFLSTFFVTPPDAFTDADTISLDIVQAGEEVAPAMKNLETGAVSIVEDTFKNREVPFPVYALDAPVSIHQLIKRQPGETALVKDKVNWLGRLAALLIPKFAKMSAMIRRSMELQAAQVLQTGTITLTDENGNPTYELILPFKATHFPEATIPWNETSADPQKDLDALADVIRDDGQADVVNLLFGRYAWDDYIRHDWVQKNLERDGLGLGALDPKILNKGAKWMGFITSGSNRYDLYVYTGRYSPFGSTEIRRYIGDHNVILLPHTSDIDFRRYFGAIPNILSDSLSNELFGDSIPIEGEYDFVTRIYPDQKKNTWVGEIKSRPILLPVSVDRFGCLNTRPSA
ncbi:hypothetical protein FACS1894161_4590 [Spirochaetia bacterium]|nr:hypothetical protein FACS1894161_4590 [Spirochaetia bacterium]